MFLETILTSLSSLSAVGPSQTMLWSSHVQTCPTVSYSGGVLRYTPPLHYFSATPCQPITFVMKICENNSADVPKCQKATIYICVLFLNPPPQFSPAVMYVLEDQTTFTSLNISAALSDVEDGTPPLNILTLLYHARFTQPTLTYNWCCICCARHCHYQLEFTTCHIPLSSY